MPDFQSKQPPRPEPRDRIAGLLCYVFGPLLLLIRSANPRVRFHAIQATLLALSLTVLNLALWIIVASLFGYSWYAGVRAESWLSYVYMAEGLLWMVMLYFGYELRLIEIPTIGATARCLAGLT